MNDNALNEARPHQDDEKTNRVSDRIENAWSEKRDSGDIDRSEHATAVSHPEDSEVQEQFDPADDFPEGGLKGWLCVIGVSIHLHCG